MNKKIIEIFKTRRLRLYYLLKPSIPRQLQIILRRNFVSRQRPLFRDIWPIDESAGKPPSNWTGWPENKRFALILTHDVETMRGQKKCENLMELEQGLGFRSSFNFVPERYPVWPHLRHLLTANRFEVGVHGLYHDGKLYASKKIFSKRAQKINEYLKNWHAVGFHSPAMQHNLDWLHELNILYDASTFDTDPFEPQPDGVGTIFPFYVNSNSYGNGYVELPYTMPQDFTLFVIMQEKNIDIWKQKLDWIAEQGGVAFLNTHPDYMNFGTGKLKMDEYPIEFFKEFLIYIKNEYNDQYWHVLPEELANFWVTRSFTEITRSLCTCDVDGCDE